MLETVLSALGVKKWIVYAVAAAVVAIAAGLFVMHYEHLEADSVAYRALKADVAAIGTHYACGSTPLGECLTARDLAGAKALLERVAQERANAALEQAKLDKDNADADAALKADEAAIAASPAGTAALTDSWRRERGSK